MNNAGPGVAISPHVHGADIAALGTSVNQVFRQKVLAGEPAGPTRPWREGV